MSDNILIWFMSAGIVQGVFLAGAFLLLNVPNKTASRLLSGLVAAMTIFITSEFLDALNSPFQPSAGLVFEYAFGPLTYLFSRAMTDSTFRPGHAARHFVPLALACLGLAILQIAFGQDGFTMSNPEAAPVIVAWSLFKIPYFLVYAWSADRVFVTAIHASRRGRRNLLPLLRGCFLALYAISGLLYLNFILFLAGAPAIPEPDFTGALALVAALYCIAYVILANRRILDAPASVDVAKTTLVADAESYLDAGHPYTDPDFSLCQLAAALGTSETQLSQALSAHFDGGFWGLVNQKRIAAIDRLMKDPVNRDRTILEPAFDAGFNSKATFYRVFKATKGATPTAYRAQLIASTTFCESHTAE